MRLVPIASDGWRFIVPLLIGGGVLLWLPSWIADVLGVLLLLGAAFCIYFFRDFNRKTAPDESQIYSPGDGRILSLGKETEGEFQDWHIIRIFLSVFDGHVQRAPVSGKIDRIQYRKGRFYDARDPRAAFQNEQNALVLSAAKGKLVVTQIAGLVARRIVCWAEEGQDLMQGERFGLIRFGSQVDVLLPPQTRVLVKPGQRVKGGLTVLATW